MAAYHQDVEFKTLDGLTIRGWLYPAKSRGPAIIITPGVSWENLSGRDPPSPYRQTEKPLSNKVDVVYFDLFRTTPSFSCRLSCIRSILPNNRRKGQE